MRYDITIYDMLLQIDREALLKDYNPKKTKEYITLDCPKCGAKGKAWLGRSGRKIHCWKHSETVDLEEIYIKKRGLSGDFRATLISLAGETGNSNYMSPPSDPEKKKAYMDWIRKIETDKNSSRVIDTALDYMKALLFSDRGQKELTYLKEERRYTEEEIRKMELGLYPPIAELKKYLVDQGLDPAGATTEDSSIFSPKELGDTHTIAIPYRDHRGYLKGFITRSILPKEELKKRTDKPKYVNTYGLPVRAQFFNMDRNRGEKALVIVEGALDALILTERGFNGVVAVATNTIRGEQLENALEVGKARIFTLLLDSDTAGSTGTETSILAIEKAGARAMVGILPAGSKDPDELLRTKGGAEALQEIIKGADFGARKLADTIPAGLGIQSLQSLQPLQIEAIVEKAIPISGSLNNSLSLDIFRRRISEMTGLSDKALDLQIKSYRDKEDQRRQIQLLKDNSEKRAELIKEGKIQELIGLSSSEVAGLRALRYSDIIRPYTLEDYTSDTMASEEGLSTGYNKLDLYAKIPQEAITIIAGRPAHGKTTLLLNLMINMVRKYPDKHFYFFSYEEARRRLVDMCLAIMSRDILNENQNLDAISAYIKRGDASRPALQKALFEFSDLACSGRLMLIDKPYFVDELAGHIDRLSQEDSNLGGVFIDYIQKVKVKGLTGKESRQVQIQKVSEAIRETAVSSRIPILCGAQLGRPDNRGKEEDAITLDNLRESGDIEQDANLVLGLLNEAMRLKDKGKDEESSRISVNKTPLQITILKNRHGYQAKEPLTLNFNRPISLITD